MAPSIGMCPRAKEPRIGPFSNTSPANRLPKRRNDNDTTTKFLREVMNTFDPSHQAIIMVSHDLSIASYFDTVIDFNKHNA